MDRRQQLCDERAARDDAMQEAEQCPEPPAAGVDRHEHAEVDEREHLAEQEVSDVADRLRAAAVGGESGPEQEREIHARQAELARGTESRGQHERSDKSAGDRAPDVHLRSAPAIEVAALIKARCTRPWGKLPRNSRLSTSISSA